MTEPSPSSFLVDLEETDEDTLCLLLGIDLNHKFEWSGAEEGEDTTEIPPDQQTTYPELEREFLGDGIDEELPTEG